METTETIHEEDRQAVEQIAASREKIEQELGRVIIGQKAAVEEILVTLFAGGNCLITGVPGLAKTLMVRAIAGIFDLGFHRIQFTPDLMPADITGTEILTDGDQGRELRFVKGPVFTNVLLADEINRTPPKTQAALLEAMQEKQVSVGGVSRELPKPFFVLATQNPIEMEGTYPLPEAQLDRFLFKLDVPFPSIDVLQQIGVQTTGIDQEETPQVMSSEVLLQIQDLVRRVVVAPEIANKAARIVVATHPSQDKCPDMIRKYVQWGASPRAMQALLVAGRAEALMQGRPWMSEEDLKRVAPDILRHRLILNFDAKLEEVTPDQLVQAVLTEIL